MEMKKQCVLLVLLTFAGCTHEPRTELIRKMEQAGAGDLREVTSQSMELWFRRNPDAAIKIRGTCRKLMTHAPAKWGDTTDGRICAAAAKAPVLYYRLRISDDLTLSAGK
jgi:hypothetical protein